MAGTAVNAVDPGGDATRRVSGPLDEPVHDRHPPLTGGSDCLLTETRTPTGRSARLRYTASPPYDRPFQTTRLPRRAERVTMIAVTTAPTG